MKLLLTRPQERTEPLKSKLMALGHDVRSFPLFRVIELPFEPFDPREYEGLIVTSFYGAKYVSGINLPIFGVGESLSEILPSAHIFPCVEKLKQSLQKKVHYIYLRGEKVTDNFHDISHDTRIVYKTEPIQEFHQDLKDFEGVIFFSKYTAEIFESLVQQSNLSVHHLEVAVLSPSIASNLTLNYKKVHVSQVPTLEAFLELLKY